jgi:hypothetical protein
MHQTFSIKAAQTKKKILQGKDLTISEKHQATPSLTLIQV